MLQHAKAKAQISRICSGMAMIGTGPACAPNGGSRASMCCAGP
jgi:hypothetical protein